MDSGIFISYAKQNVIFDNSNITVTNTKGNGLVLAERLRLEIILKLMLILPVELQV